MSADTGFGFRRNTHAADGSFREELRGVEPPADAGFLVHMLDPWFPMTRDALRRACAAYDEQFPDTAPACSDLNGNLLALLECDMAVVEPLAVAVAA
jgi:hypothetical protein